MAKKSSKSTRRARAKKEQAPKKTTTAQQTQVTPDEPVIIAEGSDEPVVEKSTPKAPAKKKKPSTADKVESQPVTPEPAAPLVDEGVIAQGAEEVALPSRRRMLASAFALAVIVIALIFGAGIMRQQQASQPTESAQPTPAGSSAEEILQSGGNVCTNQQATSDTTGSTNPQSVGMMLQTNPSNSIQTPQTFVGGGNDAAALQGASCF